MVDFLKSQVKGAMIQLAALLGIAAQNFLAPRLFGPKEYGLAIYLLAIPYFIQGLMEPVITSLTIKWQGTESHLSYLVRLWKDSALLGVVSVVGIFTFVVSASGYQHWDKWITYSILTAGLLILSIITTHLMAMAYAVQDYGSVLRGYLTSGFVLPSLLWILSVKGAEGLFLALLFNQVSVIAILLIFGKVAVSIKILLKKDVVPISNDWKNLYFPAVVPRLALVLLNTVTIFLAGLFMSLSEVASFKITLSLIAAGAYMIPVSPAILQSVLSEKIHAKRIDDQRSGLLLLGILFVFSSILAAGFFYWGDNIRLLILGIPPERTRRFDVMFIAMPFFLLIAPLSSYLFALGREHILIRAFIATFFGLLIGVIARDLPVGFILGAIGFIAVAVGLNFRPVLN